MHMKFPHDFLGFFIVHHHQCAVRSGVSLELVVKGIQDALGLSRGLLIGTHGEGPDQAKEWPHLIGKLVLSDFTHEIANASNTSVKPDLTSSSNPVI